MNPSAKNGPVSAKGAGLPNQDSLNNPKIFNTQGYNTFNRSARRLMTMRFADVHPFFAQDAIEGDNIRFTSNHDLRTYTMKSPLMSEVRMKEDYYQVPWSAILPRTWQYLYRIPVRGDDIPDDFQPTFNLSYLYSGIMFRYSTTFGSFQTPFISSSGFDSLSLGPFAFCTLHWVLNALCGSDSLLRSLGYSFPKSESFDRLYSAFVSGLASLLIDKGIKIQVAGSSSSVSEQSSTVLASRIYSIDSAASLFNFFDDFYKGLLGDYFTFIAPSGWTAMSQADVVAYFSDVTTILVNEGLDTLLQTIDAYPAVTSSRINAGGKVDYVNGEWISSARIVDMKRLVAYHLAHAQFYSNSHIDDVYTGKMWLNAQEGLFCYPTANGLRGLPRFDLNGVPVLADIHSSACLDGYQHSVGNVSYSDQGIMFRFLYFLQSPGSTSNIAMQYLSAVHFLINLFGYGSSLRSSDYFSGARLSPLAVGDYTAAVGSNGVSAIDMTKAQWMQRLLNAVNRTSQNIYEYLQAIAGVRPQRIEPQANFIVSQSWKLNSGETDNTGAAQASAQSSQAAVTTTSQLHSGSSQFAFEVYVDEPSVILGLVSFSASYVYPHAIDKSFDMKDRYDWFNHFLQHVGDQTVLAHELNANRRYDTAFGYTVRYSQFKYGISQATGGFLTGSLPSWALLWAPDMDDKARSATQYGLALADHLDSWFVRNHSFEFDRFYASLTGFDPASRFHFIISFHNEVTANSRQEDFPDLL